MSESISFSRFRAHVEALYDTGRHAKKTSARMRQVLRELEVDLGCRTTGDLTTAVMARYVAHKRPTVKANSVNSYLNSIATACSVAWEEGWISRPPAWRRVRLESEPTSRNAPPESKRVAELLGYVDGRRGNWVDRRLAALVWLVALTGMRRNEALCLPPSAVDLAARSIRIAWTDRRRLKTRGSARTVPIPDALVDPLVRWLPEAGPDWLFPGVQRRGPWTGGTGEDRALGHLKAAARAVGITQITWHALRHAYATTALTEWEAPAWVVQQTLGHTTGRMTERYLHVTNSPSIAAVSRGFAYALPGLAAR